MLLHCFTSRFFLALFSIVHVTDASLSRTVPRLSGMKGLKPGPGGDLNRSLNLAPRSQSALSFHRLSSSSGFIQQRREWKKA